MTRRRRSDHLRLRSLGQRLVTRVMVGSGDGPPDVSKLRYLPGFVRFPMERRGLDPLARLTKARRTEPVKRLVHIFGRDMWLISNDELARKVLSDSTTFSNDIRPLFRPDGGSDAEQIGGLGFTDPPDHTMLRKLLTPEFTMRRLARLDPLIRQIVATKLADVRAAADGRPDAVVDIVETFAFAVPFQVICELLGLPEDQRHVLADLGEARFDLTNPGAEAFGSAVGARQFWFDQVAYLREHPNDGLISALIQRNPDLDDVVLGGLADGLFLGGYETSASMLALGTITILQKPGALELFATCSDTQLHAMVEELLRYLSVVQVGFLRFARTDVQLGEVPVKAGDIVAVSMLGANRDESVFGSDAGSFNPERSPHPHLAFGHGMHRCVGAELARMELRIAFRELARTYPNLALATDVDDLRFRKTSIVYGVEAVPVRLGKH